MQSVLFEDYLKQRQAEGQWFVIAPDGRVWTSTDPQQLIAALAQEKKDEST